MEAMLKHPHRRRFLSASLVILGVVLIFLVPEDAWTSGVLALAGILVELIAFGFMHRNNARK